jgi:hypothetical protein
MHNNREAALTAAIFFKIRRKLSKLKTSKLKNTA